MTTASLDTLTALKQAGLRSLYPDRIKINVGMATCGISTGAGQIYDCLVREIKEQKIDAAVRKTGCIGFCQIEPLFDITIPGNPKVLYSRLTPQDMPGLLKELAGGGLQGAGALARITEEVSLIDNSGKQYKTDRASAAIRELPALAEIPFYKKQLKIALNNCGFIDPDCIEEYCARGGYFPLHKVLIIKWETCREAHGDEKYIICNADEGDPGAYMDRSILEGDPHCVLEGMIIAGFAIGSGHGYIYVRNEYPLAVERLTIAIAQAREQGLLGKNIFGTGFDFDIKIARGGGAFVCGESTALMASLEGQVGRPRAKYIHTVEKGFRDSPSSLNNVETWANVPVIMSRGADWYTKIGTPNSPGTKVFSVVGKINNTGLVEVPMGISLREIVFDIGGGVPDGKKFKAVQTGGPSGGCIPEKMIDLPVDFDELYKVGSMMGSGGMIVMDETTCMVDLARYFIDFLKEESCGKCVPCREGIKRMLQILTGICEGKGKMEDIALLEELSQNIKKTALCALGGSAPNPVLTTLQYFRDEYEAHIKDKKCPAGLCRDLIQYTIDQEKCTGCGRCAKECPQEAVSGSKKKPHSIDQTKCIKCDVCREACKFDAVVVK
ncbi:MAG: 4Fe-4S binding protein [Proteobacteria bacterium]|nr:4Fe-4S binding protein [Pseudomonadota bacterium]